MQLCPAQASFGTCCLIIADTTRNFKLLAFLMPNLQRQVLALQSSGPLGLSTVSCEPSLRLALALSSMKCYFGDVLITFAEARRNSKECDYGSEM